MSVGKLQLPAANVVTQDASVFKKRVAVQSTEQYWYKLSHVGQFKNTFKFTYS